MTDAKHTPGPWRVEDGTTLIWGHCNPDDVSSRGMGYPVAEARISPSRSWANGPDVWSGEANARLIAAAPDLLKALEELQRCIIDQGFPQEGHMLVTCSAAIAKARGAA